MSDKYLDATSVAIQQGILVDVTGKNSFNVCCIGHAQQLSMHLTGRRIPHKHEGIAFVILSEPILEEPRVVVVTTPTLTSYRIRFDRSITDYAQHVAKIGDDDGLEQYQEVIESLEHRVIIGLMGSTAPERISVQWDKDDALIVTWEK